MALIINGTDGVQFNDASLQGAAASPYVLKNRIINGAMVIDQRNAGASGTSIDAYTVDRFKFYSNVSGKMSWQQNAGSVTPPAGFVNYFGLTTTSAYSVAAGDTFGFLQSIEGFNVADLGWGTSNAKTVTLSFWVRSSLTGTFGGAFRNNAGDRSYPFTYTISSANTWTQISLTIAGDTTGTWPTNNSGSIQIWFSLGTGTTYSGTAGSWAGADYRSSTGATSVVGTNGATFYITGVQLEVGSTATPFERRLYGNELNLCRRYAYIDKIAGGGAIGGSSTAVIGILFPQKMRATPTITFVTGGSVGNGSASQGIPSLNGTDSASDNQSLIIVNLGGSLGTAGTGCYLWNSTFSFVAEL
jgi:hypothetical protein